MDIPMDISTDISKDLSMDTSMDRSMDVVMTARPCFGSMLSPRCHALGAVIWPRDRAPRSHVTAGDLVDGRLRLCLYKFKTSLVNIFGGSQVQH